MCEHLFYNETIWGRHIEESILKHENLTIAQIFVCVPYVWTHIYESRKTLTTPK